MDTLELLLHPVRLRIVHAMSSGRIRTTADLCALLPDVAKATVYRHVGALAEAGLLEVVDEQRVHGAVERSYRLRDTRIVVDEDMARSMSVEDHRRGFAAAVAALLAEFNTYLDQRGAEPFGDSVGYRQATLWLDEDELATFVTTITEALRTVAAHRPHEGRRPYRASMILFPEPPGQPG